MEALGRFFDAIESNEVSELTDSLAQIFSLWRSGRAGAASDSVIRTISIEKPAGFLTFAMPSSAAEAWVKLGRGTQNRLVEGIRSMTSADPSVVISSIFGMFQNIATLPLVLANIQRTNRRILKSQAEALKELKQIASEVKRIETRLDEDILAKARKGLLHLVVGANSDVAAVREQQLQLASGDFSSLIALDTEETTVGTSGKTKNVDLAVFGYWGNHLCFGLQGDQKSALSQIYESTIKHPLPSLRCFSSEYFFGTAVNNSNRCSYSYRDALESLAKNKPAVKQALDMANKKHRRLLSWFRVAKDLWDTNLFLGFTSIPQMLRAMLNEPDMVARDLKKYLVYIEEEERRLSVTLNKECRARLNILRPISVEELGHLTFVRPVP
ncbi:MAG TPA: hypothetical protein VGS07_17910 [Thermoanaerobaculia bacterium]|jgi:hypothetical protein|nr:hypothetical protein [Thermoanaerobaculia bacterium]